MQPNITFRTIIYSDRFESELYALIPDAHTADEFICGVEWVVSRRPMFGTQIAPKSKVWMIGTPDEAFVTPMVIYYTFNENQVWFLSIQRATSFTGEDEIPF